MRLKEVIERVTPIAAHFQEDASVAALHFRDPSVDVRGGTPVGGPRASSISKMPAAGKRLFGLIY